MGYFYFDEYGYAYTAVCLLIMAAYAAVHLALVRPPHPPARWLLFFFLCLMAGNLAVLLTNTLIYWGVIFAPLSDAFVLLGGVALVQFATIFPEERPAQQMKWTLAALLALTIAAFGAALAWAISFFLAPDPWRWPPGEIYYLMPLGILLVFVTFMRRVLQLDERAAPLAPRTGLRQKLAILLRPRAGYARAHWMFGLSTLLGALPAIGTLAAGAGLLDKKAETLLIGAGSILACAAIFITYLYFTSAWTSFSVRLVSIELVTLLVISNSIGVFLINQVRLRIAAETQALVYVTGQLDLAGFPAAAPAAVAYLADWGPAGSAAPALHYRRADLSAELLAGLRPPERTYNPNTLFIDDGAQRAAIQQADPSFAATNWQPATTATSYGGGWVDRITDPRRWPIHLFMGFSVLQEGVWYEIGLDAAVLRQRLTALTALLMSMTFTGLLLILTGHMLLIRPTLISPLTHLLAGVRRVTAGDLRTTLPVTYNDEIGVLTSSFNMMAANVRDLTEGLEQKVAARTTELAAAKERAEQASRAKSIFLANVSHELRTPLTAMLGFTELLVKRRDLDAATRAEIAMIHDNGQQLLLLVNDMLTITRLEAGDLRLTPRTIALRALVDQTVRLFRLAAESRQIYLTVAYGDAAPDGVVADSDKLQQILNNMISHAIKCTPSGALTLHVAALPVRGDLESGCLLAIGIKCAGGALPPEELAAHFAGLELSDTATAATALGLGVGLSVSRRLALFLGGDLTVVSGEPGSTAADAAAGVTFQLTLPVQRTALAAVETSAALQAAPVMLVADDADANRALLTRHLRSLGHTVHEARNGAEALAQWRQHQPDVIWLDMRMPIVSGQEVVRQVRSEPAGAATRIIAVTASAFEEDRAALLALGCDELLRKPYRRQELVALLAKLPLGRTTPAPASPLSPASPLPPVSPLPPASPRQVIHDLRNIAAALSGLAELVRDERSRLTPAELERCLAEIVASSHRLGTELETLSQSLRAGENRT